MRQLVYITGSGHSGSTLLDRLLGSHPDIAALGEVHRFSLGLHRSEKPFRCDCGETISDCAFWSEVIDRMAVRIGVEPSALKMGFQTTDHSVLGQQSGEKYFNAEAKYQFLPRKPEKYLLAAIPSALAPVFDRLGAFGKLLEHARNSHLLFDAVAEVSGISTIVDSTKNPIRMRALHLTAQHRYKVIYLKRDGRAVSSSRIKRQPVDMERAAKIWMAENRKIRLVLSMMKNVDLIEVRYENLCKDPGAELARLYRFLDLPDAPGNLAYERHAIGGNPSRFDARKTVVADEKWRTELSELDLQIFERVVGIGNKNFWGN